MSPFGSTNGGSLDDDQINSIVAYLRSWQANPPVTTPPQFTLPILTMSASDIYAKICSQCHGQNGVGTAFGPTLNDLSDDTDQEISAVISQGITDTNMLAFGSILSDQQMSDLVALIRTFPPPSSPQMTPTPQPAPTNPTFTADVLPIFEQYCKVCHGNLGGWDSTSYQTVMTWRSWSGGDPG
jgi:mono/diheme cytochrome c family protein